MRRKRKLFLGVGINDADYQVKSGGKVICPYFSRWRSMMQRCYSRYSLSANPTYSGCTVCDEWLSFSNFKSWMEKQDWEGNHLDKDIIGDGSQYSSESCRFVSGAVNNLILDSKKRRGELPIGVSFHKATGRLRARCSNPITKTDDHLGYFDTEDEAHRAWVLRKLEIIRQIKPTITIEIFNALTLRYERMLK